MKVSYNRKMRLLKLLGISALMFIFLHTVSGVQAQSAHTATLSLNPDWVVYSANMEIPVDIVVNPGNHEIDGVDAVLTYDDSVLTVKSIDTTDYFSTYPVHSAANGKITVSGLAAINEPITVGGVMATVTFTVAANPPQDTTIAFVVGTDDGSHVAEHGTSTDVLFTTNSATFATYENPNSTPTPTITPTPMPGSTVTPTQELLPKTGIVEDTFLMGLFSLVLFIGGAFILRKPF